MDQQEKIKDLRAKINETDREILRLLDERAAYALEAGRIKSQGGLDFYDPKRETEIIELLTSYHPGPFPEKALSSVFREIISGCRSLEVKLDVVYLGPEATNTHAACLAFFGTSIRAVPKEGLQEVFESVERGEAGYGVVPVENTTEGSVTRTLDLLIETEVKICGETLLRISHDLLSLPGKPEKVEKIYSHPQAFGQCRKWLRKNFPSVPLIETTSTARAAQIAAEDPHAAAIANPLASSLYGLRTVRAQIEDYFHNYTRFLILSQRNAGRTGKDKTSIVLSIPHAAGTLYQVLQHFSERGISLTKIESRPVRDRAWEYVFFIDFEGHTDDAAIQELLADLEKNTLFLKILGAYPQGL